MKIAIIGAGIAGLSCAYTIERHLRETGRHDHQVTAKDAYFKDPFNEVCRIDDIERIFTHLFK